MKYRNGAAVRAKARFSGKIDDGNGDAEDDEGDVSDYAGPRDVCRALGVRGWYSPNRVCRD